MGRTEEMMVERKQKQDDERLASLLGNIYNELAKTEFYIETDVS
jgi:predicted aminopeptidase